MNIMESKQEYEIETGKSVYDGEGQMIPAGSYSDEYVKWLENKLKNIVGLDNVSESCLDLNQAVLLMKSMPSDQAIQQIKSKLSRQPSTTVIEGDLFIRLYYNSL